MDSRVRQAISLLSEDLSCDFDFKTLAASVNLSPSRLRHLFKDETGLTPAQYLKRLRLERARELLDTSFLRLKEVIVSSRLLLLLKKLLVVSTLKLGAQFNKSMSES